MSQEVNAKKVLTGILAILFGVFGIHKFMLGYTTALDLSCCLVPFYRVAY